MRKGSNSIQTISNRISHGNDAFDRDNDRDRGLGKFYLENLKFFKIHVDDPAINRFLELSKAANALTRLSNTYQIPIHKLAGEDDSVAPLELSEIIHIAKTYKEKTRLWVDI